MTNPSTARPEPCSFDLVGWAVADSFKRVGVNGPFSLTNQILHHQPHLDCEQANAKLFHPHEKMSDAELGGW